MATATDAEFIEVADTVVADHTPYVYGGDSLTSGCDCSGVIYEDRIQLGLPAGPRTTQGMYEDAMGSQTIYQFIPTGQQRPGDLPIFNVPGDGGDPPQHIGVYIGNGQMIEEPHTGLFGEIVTVPNEAGEMLMGYLRMKDVVPATTTPQKDDVNSYFTYDPKTGGVAGTDANGDIFNTGGANFAGALSEHPNYHAGDAESGNANPCVGISYWAADGNDGVMFFTAPSSGHGGWDGTSDGTPYDIYRFLRDGTPA